MATNTNIMQVRVNVSIRLTMFCVSLLDVEHQNMEGVLATARAEDHACYVETLPQTLKEQVRHSLRKKK